VHDYQTYKMKVQRLRQLAKYYELEALRLSRFATQHHIYTNKTHQLKDQADVFRLAADFLETWENK
jgi:hypothetical protein